MVDFTPGAMVYLERLDGLNDKAHELIRSFLAKHRTELGAKLWSTASRELFLNWIKHARLADFVDVLATLDCTSQAHAEFATVLEGGFRKLLLQGRLIQNERVLDEAGQVRTYMAASGLHSAFAQMAQQRRTSMGIDDETYALHMNELRPSVWACLEDVLTGERAARLAQGLGISDLLEGIARDLQPHMYSYAHATVLLLVLANVTVGDFCIGAQACDDEARNAIMCVFLRGAAYLRNVYTIGKGVQPTTSAAATAATAGGPVSEVDACVAWDVFDTECGNMSLGAVHPTVQAHMAALVSPLMAARMVVSSFPCFKEPDNTAGPYAKDGTTFVKACAEAGVPIERFTSSYRRQASAEGCQAMFAVVSLGSTERLRAGNAGPWIVRGDTYGRPALRFLGGSITSLTVGQVRGDILTRLWLLLPVNVVDGMTGEMGLQALVPCPRTTGALVLAIMQSSQVVTLGKIVRAFGVHADSATCISVFQILHVPIADLRKPIDLPKPAPAASDDTAKSGPNDVWGPLYTHLSEISMAAVPVGVSRLIASLIPGGMVSEIVRHTRGWLDADVVARNGTELVRACVNARLTLGRFAAVVRLACDDEFCLRFYNIVALPIDKLRNGSLAYRGATDILCSYGSCLLRLLPESLYSRSVRLLPKATRDSLAALIPHTRLLDFTRCVLLWSSELPRSGAEIMERAVQDDSSIQKLVETFRAQTDSTTCRAVYGLLMSPPAPAAAPAAPAPAETVLSLCDGLSSLDDEVLELRIADLRGAVTTRIARICPAKHIPQIAEFMCAGTGFSDTLEDVLLRAVKKQNPMVCVLVDAFRLLTHATVCKALCDILNVNVSELVAPAPSTARSASSSSSSASSAMTMLAEMAHGTPAEPPAHCAPAHSTASRWTITNLSAAQKSRLQLELGNAGSTAALARELRLSDVYERQRKCVSFKENTAAAGIALYSCLELYCVTLSALVEAARTLGLRPLCEYVEACLSAAESLASPAAPLPAVLPLVLSTMNQLISGRQTILEINRLIVACRTWAQLATALAGENIASCFCAPTDLCAYLVLPSVAVTMDKLKEAAERCGMRELATLAQCAIDHDIASALAEDEAALGKPEESEEKRHCGQAMLTVSTIFYNLGVIRASITAKWPHYADHKTDWMNTHSGRHVLAFVRRYVMPHYYYLLRIVNSRVETDTMAEALWNMSGRLQFTSAPMAATVRLWRKFLSPQATDTYQSVGANLDIVWILVQAAHNLVELCKMEDPKKYLCDEVHEPADLAPADMTAEEREQLWRCLNNGTAWPLHTPEFHEMSNRDAFHTWLHTSGISFKQLTTLAEHLEENRALGCLARLNVAHKIGLRARSLVLGVPMAPSVAATEAPARVGKPSRKVCQVDDFPEPPVSMAKRSAVHVERTDSSVAAVAVAPAAKPAAESPDMPDAAGAAPGPLPPVSECIVCMEDDMKPNHVLSCGHLLCEGCARTITQGPVELRRCPTCRNEITQMMLRVYI